jgi:ABC-type amino acid transport substrate-binding protein
MTEKELVQRLKDLRVSIKAKNDELDEIKADEMKAERDLIEMLEEKQADATAQYEGVGYARLAKPRIYASVTKDKEMEAIAYLEQIGRADMVKPSITGLNAFVGELMESGEEVPAVVSYYIKQSVKIYG